MEEDTNFNPASQNLDINWLEQNGWTIGGNLAYRHILHEYNQSGVLSPERVEEIIVQYAARKQVNKIKEALQELNVNSPQAD